VSVGGIAGRRAGRGGNGSRLAGGWSRLERAAWRTAAARNLDPAADRGRPHPRSGHLPHIGHYAIRAAPPAR